MTPPWAVRRQRYLVVAAAFVAVFICYLDRVSMAVAIVPLAAERDWSATQIGAVLSAFFIGYLACQLPAGWAARRFGGRRLIGAALLAWSLMTALTPVSVSLGFGVLIIVRSLMGAGEAGMFPGAYALFADWVAPAERSRAVGVLFSAIPLGTLVALGLSGFLTAHYGWSAVFYIYSLVGAAFAILWYRAVPPRAPALSAEGQDETAGKSPTISWRRFLTKRPVWALIINSFATSWSIYVLLSWTPLYLGAVHHIAIADAGLLAGAPWIAMFLMINIAGWVADWLVARGWRVLTVRKLMQATGLFGTAACLLAMPLAETPVAAIALLCGALGINGLTMAGFAPNHLELAPRAAAQLNSLTNLAGTLPGVVGVFATGWIVDITGSYDAAFIVASLVSAGGAVVWLAWASSEPLDNAFPS